MHGTNTKKWGLSFTFDMVHVAYRFYCNKKLLKCNTALKILYYLLTLKSPCLPGDFLEDIEIGFITYTLSGSERPWQSLSDQTRSKKVSSRHIPKHKTDMITIPTPYAHQSSVYELEYFYTHFHTKHWLKIQWTTV
jgi:hypothetical protein